MTLKPEIPVLAGYLDHDHRGTQLNVWCMFCVKWHYHGGPTLARDPSAKIGDITHRTAHCYVPWSPYRPTGYYIRMTDIPFSCVQKSVKVATSHQLEIMFRGRTTAAIDRLHMQDGPSRMPGCNAVQAVPEIDWNDTREVRHQRYLAAKKALDKRESK